MNQVKFDKSKFAQLSDKSKLLLTASITFNKDLSKRENDIFFYEIIGLNYPDDEFLYNYYLTEIQNQKIKYKLQKIKFLPPSIDDCYNFLVTYDKLLKKRLSSEQKKQLSDLFLNHYTSKNWKVGKHKIQITSWQHALIKAANSWILPKQKTTTEFFDNIERAFNEFNDF